jgi:hypothetical protein
MLCDFCKIDYPGRLVRALMNFKMLYGFACGQCALDIINEKTGSHFRQCSDPGWEKLRQEAIAYRKFLEGRSL